MSLRYSSTEGFKLFGKEPAFWVGVAQAVVGVLVTLFLSNDAGIAIMGLVIAVGGVLEAWTTKDTLLAALVAVVKAIFVMTALIGYNLSAETQIAVISLITIFLSGFLRTQTSAVPTALSSPSPGYLAGDAGLPRAA